MSAKKQTLDGVFAGDCGSFLRRGAARGIALSFVDPPFNQGKDYRCFDDSQDNDAYWDWMRDTFSLLRAATLPGGAVYFMHREKNAEFVLRVLRETGWNLRNLIVWKKMTSAVPCSNQFGKHYQIIAFAVNGKKPRLFNRLRIAPPPPPHYKLPREGGVYVTDVWDDIREMTAGYFAGDEALRAEDGGRIHKQQSPLALLARIIMSSSMAGDLVFDPFCGTGTTLVAAAQLSRRYVGAEIDPQNADCIRRRLQKIRPADNISKLLEYYRFTDNLSEIWHGESAAPLQAAAGLL